MPARPLAFRVRALAFVLLAQLAAALVAAPATGLSLADSLPAMETVGAALPERPSAPADAPPVPAIDADAIAADLGPLVEETLGVVLLPLAAADPAAWPSSPPDAPSLVPAPRRYADRDYARLPEPFIGLDPSRRAAPPEVVDVTPPPETSGPLETSVGVATVAVGLTALAFGGASLYSRFQKRDVLRSQTRARLLALAQASPGSTLAELCRHTGMSRGTLAHHVQMLERHSLLTSRHDGLHRRYYPASASVVAGARPPTAGERRVLEVLRERGPLTQRELARLLGVTPQAVGPQVHRLRDHGRLVVDATDGRPRWTVAPQEAPTERPV